MHKLRISVFDRIIVKHGLSLCLVMFSCTMCVFLLKCQFVMDTKKPHVDDILLCEFNCWINLNVLHFIFRSAILHGYKHIYGKVVLDVGAGTGQFHACVHNLLIYFIHSVADCTVKMSVN